MEHLLCWHKGQISADCPQDTLRVALQDRKAVSWLDLRLVDGLAQYKSLLVDEFQLSKLTIETIEEHRERARLVQQRNYFYLVVHGMQFDKEQEEASTPKLDIVFGQNFLITIHREAMPWLEALKESVSRDQSTENVMGQGMARLLHAILDTLVDTYFPVLDTLDDIVDELENATVENANNQTQARLFRIKRSIALLRRAISPQIEVMNSLITRTGDFIPTEIEPYFADVHDHLVRTFEVLDSYRDLMSSLLDVYLTTISNRQNEIMKQLAIIATIFLPITFITGVFGQNFGHSPQVEHDPGLNFWAVLAFMALVTLAQLWYFRRRWI